MEFDQLDRWIRCLFATEKLLKFINTAKLYMEKGIFDTQRFSYFSTKKKFAAKGLEPFTFVFQFS